MSLVKKNLITSLFFYSLISKTITEPSNQFINIKNNTGLHLEIFWISDKSIVILKNSILGIKAIQNLKIPVSAEKFKIKSDKLSSNIAKITENENYQINCKISSGKCHHLLVKDQTSKSVYNKSKKISIYLINNTKKVLQLNWFDENGLQLSKKTINANQSKQKFSIISNAINFTISDINQTITSLSTMQVVDELYQIDCALIKNVCTEFTITDKGPILNATSVNTLKGLQSNNYGLDNLKTSNSLDYKTNTTVQKKPTYISSTSQPVFFSMSDYTATASARDSLLPDYESNTPDSNTNKLINSQTQDNTDASSNNYQTSDSFDQIKQQSNS